MLVDGSLVQQRSTRGAGVPTGKEAGMSEWQRLTITGPLAGAHAYQEKSRILHKLGRDSKHLEIDLSGVTGLDAVGAQVLVDLNKALQNRFGEFRLVHVPEQLVQELAYQHVDQQLLIAS